MILPGVHEQVEIRIKATGMSKEEELNYQIETVIIKSIKKMKEKVVLAYSGGLILR